MELVSLEVESFHLVIAAGRVMTHGDGEPGLANRCNSHFHRRVLEALLPPPYTVRPIFCHQLRMAFMAKLAVS